MRVLLLPVLAALVAGCNFPFGTDGGTSSGPPPANGFGKPTVEVTIDSAHFGPATPDPGAVASLVDSLDSSGRVITSTFRVAASTGGAACSIAVQRFGNDGVAPIGALPYLIGAPGDTGTADGMVAPVEGEAVSAPQGSFNCTGNACNGVGFDIRYLAADHVEGWLSGTFASNDGSSASQITCSFWLPFTSYSP
jgi:hypothetical protein